MTRAGAVELAVRRDLRQMPAVARKSALALAALQAARSIDLTEVCESCGEKCGHLGLHPRDLAVLIRELRATVVEMAKLNPPAPAKDGIDDLAARRERRRSS